MKKNKKEIKLSEKMTTNIFHGKNTKSHNFLEKLLVLKCTNKITKTLKKLNKSNKQK